MTDNRKHVFGTKRGLVIIGVIFLVCVGGLVLLSKWIQPGIFTPGEATPVPIVVGITQSPDGDSDKYKIGVELSDGQSQPQTVEVLPATTGEPLSPEEIALILSRLPALTPDPDEQTEFNLPQEILPPPRPGNTIQETFPASRNRTNSGGGWKRVHFKCCDSPRKGKSPSHHLSALHSISQWFRLGRWAIWLRRMCR